MRGVSLFPLILLHMLAACARNEIVLIATQWANQGIDEPKMTCLILACSTKAEATVRQQIGRVLRTAKDKTHAFVFDFIDMHPAFRKHANMREKILQSERAWTVVEIGKRATHRRNNVQTDKP